MAEGATGLKGLRAQMAAAAQAQAEERRSLAGNSPLSTTNTAAKPQGCKPVIDGATLRVDDKLRVARERREEAEKQQALRESQIMERERKAKLQVERQLEERQKKLEEQKKKEEQRRQAAEDKRKQKQEEEKEHYKAVMQRTLERSHRVEEKQKRWSWGGLTSDSDGHTAHRPQTCIVDEGLLSRLLTPTQASLARSKSAAALSAEGTDSQECHLCPRSASDSPLQLQRGPVRSRSSDRHKSGMTSSDSADGALDPALNKTLPRAQRPPSPSSTFTRNRSPSPAPSPAPKRTPSPSAAKQSSRTRPPSPGVMKQRPPSPQPMPSKPPPIQKPALTPTGPPTLRKRDSKSKDLCPVQPVAALSPDASKPKEKDDSKGVTGTNSAAEAAKILAENRRLMREQKEKEEQLRIQREEEEKLRIEEEKRLAEEARLKRVEEEKKLAEERRLREEEEARQAEEERVRLAEEEVQRQAELQREKEEAEARALEKAVRERQERDRQMQQDQQARMERKKRIEEIMKRTRKGEQNDSKKDEDNILEINGVEVNDEMICDMNEYGSELSTEAENEVCELSYEEQTPQNKEPVNSVNGRPETEDKENNNGISTEETHAGSPVPKARLVEGSEFVNEEDPAKIVPGLNGKSNQWSFEDFIDLNGHKTRPLMETGDRNQVLIDCDGTPEGNVVTFEGTPVNTVHSSNQPIEALSEI